MVRVFVAQTHEKDRQLVSDFLKAAFPGANSDSISSYATDPVSLTWLTRNMMFAKEPFVLITSQRDIIGCNYLSGLLHTVALNHRYPTLTIVYSRAVAHQENIPGVIQFMADLVSTPGHQLKMVPKDAEDTREAEHHLILSLINRFASPSIDG